MRKLSIYLLSTILCGACSNDTHKIQSNKDIKTQIQRDVPLITTAPDEQSSIACLDNQVHYLETKPENLKEFGIRMGEAVIHCHASREQMAAYVAKIIEKQGDYR